jgi:hypothetical protein
MIPTIAFLEQAIKAQITRVVDLTFLCHSLQAQMGTSNPKTTLKTVPPGEKRNSF